MKPDINVDEIRFVSTQIANCLPDVDGTCRTWIQTQSRIFEIGIRLAEALESAPGDAVLRSAIVRTLAEDVVRRFQFH